MKSISPANQTPASVDYTKLVQKDRVNSRLYTDPSIFDEEMERIWRRGWVFVAHESELPEPGD